MDTSVLRTRTAKVLCVDDDDDGRAACAAALEHEGFTVYEAPDGVHAIAVARQVLPDVVLLDLALPHVDGWTVATALKADPRTGRTHIIAFTATLMPEDRERALAAGCEVFLEKPADLVAIVQAVRDVLGLPTLRKNGTAS